MGFQFNASALMQANALVDLGLAQATVEKREHGMAGVDDIRSQGGIGGQQTGQKASVAISQQEGVAGAGEMGELGIAAAGEPGPKTDVFEPPIGAGDAIEVGIGSTHRAKGNRANGVSRAASAAMRRCRGESWELRASRVKSRPLLTIAAR